MLNAWNGCARKQIRNWVPKIPMLFPSVSPTEQWMAPSAPDSVFLLTEAQCPPWIQTNELGISFPFSVNSIPGELTATSYYHNWAKGKTRPDTSPSERAHGRSRNLFASVQSMVSSSNPEDTVVKMARSFCSFPLMFWNHVSLCTPGCFKLMIVLLKSPSGGITHTPKHVLVVREAKKFMYCPETFWKTPIEVTVGFHL